MAIQQPALHPHYPLNSRDGLQFIPAWPSDKPFAYKDGPSPTRIYAQQQHQQQQQQQQQHLFPLSQNYFAKPLMLSLNIPYIGVFPQPAVPHISSKHGGSKLLLKQQQQQQQYGYAMQTKGLKNVANQPSYHHHQQHRGLPQQQQQQEEEAYAGAPGGTLYPPQFQLHQVQLPVPLVVQPKPIIPQSLPVAAQIAVDNYYMPHPYGENGHHRQYYDHNIPHPVRPSEEQKQAQRRIFDIPRSLVDAVVTSFNVRVEPRREMQYKRTVPPPQSLAVTVVAAAGITTHNSSPQSTEHQYTDPKLAYPDLHEFVEQFLRNNRIPMMVLVHALVYLERFSKRLPKRSAARPSTPHLTFLAAILVAAKYCDDLCMLTSRDISMQYRGLFSIQDVSRIERSFMIIIRYKLRVEMREVEPILREHSIDIDRILEATHVSPP